MAIIPTLLDYVFLYVIVIMFMNMRNKLKRFPIVRPKMLSKDEDEAMVSVNICRGLDRRSLRQCIHHLGMVLYHLSRHPRRCYHQGCPLI